MYSTLSRVEHVELEICPLCSMFLECLFAVLSQFLTWFFQIFLIFEWNILLAAAWGPLRNHLWVFRLQEADQAGPDKNKLLICCSS